jgi:hypothetical protein
MCLVTQFSDVSWKYTKGKKKKILMN